MAKLDCCNRCRFYSQDSHLVCALHPDGVEGDSCNDFELRLDIPDEEAMAWYGEQWQPEGASYYGGELVLEPVQQLTLEQRLELLDTHPLFTGRCPNCEMPLRQTDPPRIHWDCEHCGWVDDSV
jgi:hypothetical protein